MIGKFIGNERGFGFVTFEDGPADIFIPRHFTAGALNGDMVEVRRESGVQDMKGPAGRVIKLVRRFPIVGTYIKNSSGSYVVPINKNVPYRFTVSLPIIKTHNLTDGMSVLFSVDKRHNALYGEMPCYIVEVLGHKNDTGVDVLTLIRQARVPYEFSDEVLEEIEALPNEVFETDLTKRKDLREDLIFTIDGDDTKDIDDAISIEVTQEGNYRLSVHIADVAHYVQPNTALSESALERGTSVYLADRVIPMLPARLSNGICSLFPNVDRLTLSCVMIVDKKGKVRKHRIFTSVIRSKRQWTYQEVQNILDEPEGAEYKENGTDWRSVFKLLDEFRQVLLEKRKLRGALDFDMPEAKIEVDDNGRPVSIELYPKNQATGIIEECMILCNETIAKHFLSRKFPFVYRSHETPDAKKFKELKTYLRNYGLANTLVKPYRPTAVQRVLTAAEGTPAAVAVHIAVLRTLPQACYSHTSGKHFGLASTGYCHFTSPIRRYADLQIHRIIKSILRGEDAYNLYIDVVPEVCKICSRTERTAETLERDVADLKKAQFMANKEGQTFDAVVTGVTTRGIYVTLPTTVEGMVPIATLTNLHYFYDEENETFEQDKHSPLSVKTLRHGTKVTVRLEEVNERERRLKFTLT